MAQKAERLIPDLTPYPPAEYMVVYHPDVQLTTEEWLELSDYDKLESATLCDPGVLGLMLKAGHRFGGIPVHAYGAVHQGRLG